MKALSIRQPWAQLIVLGIPIFESVDIGDGRSRVEWQGKVAKKNIENRTWPTFLRERVYVHAAKRVDKDAQIWLMERGFAPMTVLMCYSNRVPRAALVGEVDITDCVTQSDNPWFTGPYGFVLANPVVYEKPIPYRGQQGFFEVEEVG